MAKTINRRPIYVNTPNNDDLKEYSFDNYSWTGLNDNVNPMSANQNSFSDLCNVYINTEGLLCSRPSLHVIDFDYSVDDVTILDDVFVYTVGDTMVVYDDGSKLGAVNEPGYTVKVNDLLIIFPDEVKDPLNDYGEPFGVNLNNFYDDTGRVNYVLRHSLIYIPENVHGAVDESYNVLTTAKYNVYIYDENIKSPDLLLKTFNFKIDGNEYQITTRTYDDFFNIFNKIRSNSTIKFDEKDTRPLLLAKNTSLGYDIVVLVGGTTILYTIDGKNFNYIENKYDVVLNEYVQVKLTHDGKYLCFYDAFEVHFLDLLEETWTDVSLEGTFGTPDQWSGVNSKRSLDDNYMPARGTERPIVADFISPSHFVVVGYSVLHGEFASYFKKPSQNAFARKHVGRELSRTLTIHNIYDYRYYTKEIYNSISCRLTPGYDYEFVITVTSATTEKTFSVGIETDAKV